MPLLINAVSVLLDRSLRWALAVVGGSLTGRWPRRTSGQRTEKPTPKRLREARRKGQIPRSPDLVGWAALLVATYVLPMLLALLEERFRVLLPDRPPRPWPPASGRRSPGRDRRPGPRPVAVTVFFPFLAFLVVVVIRRRPGGPGRGDAERRAAATQVRADLAQGRRSSGWCRRQSAVDTAKAVLLRLVILAVLMWRIMAGQIDQFLGGGRRSADRSAGWSWPPPCCSWSAWPPARRGGRPGDYAYQRWKVGRQLRMTKEEVKRENRNTEGDPLHPGPAPGQLHARVSRNKMLAAVGEASVVVVNPTHISVALSYSAGSVPKVVAKGADELALRIRERAFEAGVPVVESRPLARALHDLIEVGEEVPAHLYEAVAIVIAFVMRLPPTALSRPCAGSACRRPSWPPRPGSRTRRPTPSSGRPDASGFRHRERQRPSADGSSSTTGTRGRPRARSRIRRRRRGLASCGPPEPGTATPSSMPDVRARTTAVVEAESPMTSARPTRFERSAGAGARRAGRRGHPRHAIRGAPGDRVDRRAAFADPRFPERGHRAAGPATPWAAPPGSPLDFWDRATTGPAAEAELARVPPASVVAVVGPLDAAVAVVRRCRDEHWMGVASTSTC